MGAPRVGRLLAFARELQRAESFYDLLVITQTELEAALGYRHAWLFVGDSDDPHEMRLIDVAGAVREAAWEAAPVLTIAGDPMLEELVRGDAPVVVEDARTDPRTNKAMVEQLQNRTIINVPLRLLDKPFGAFGTGTFGDEGCRPPTAEQLDFLIGMGSQLSVAAGRIRYREERGRNELAMRRVEEQLRQSQKMEAVGRLAGGVAHDFNNLLSVILSYSHIVLEDLGDDAPLRHEIDQIKNAAERAAALTHQLLAFSRNRVAMPSAIDLNDVVVEMDGMIRRIIGEDIEFDTVVQKPLQRVWTDRGLVEQVIMNLVVNARDAMPGGGKLLIETADVVLDEDYARNHVDVVAGPFVMLAVSDTGVGMDKATQERIFEPFFTTKEIGKGTGLGLSTVYGLVKQSGGSVHVYSEVGSGTVFRTYLPATNALGTRSERPASAPVDVHGDETVLLVEDDEQVRTVIREILERHGYVVLEAKDIEHALHLGATHPGAIDLVLTDVVMPRMSGGDLVEQLAGMRPTFAVLYMSGYTETSIVQHRGMDLGLALLPKPITPDALLRKVRDVLARALTSTA